MARRRWVFPLANVDGWGWDHGLKCFPGMARASPALWNERVRAVPTPGWLDMMHCFDSILHWFLHRVLVRSVWQVGFSPSFSTEGVLGMEEKGQCMWLHDLGWFLRLETCFDDCFSASLCSQTADGWPLGNFWNICHGFTCTRCTTVHTHTHIRAVSFGCPSGPNNFHCVGVMLFYKDAKHVSSIMLNTTSCIHVNAQQPQASAMKLQLQSWGHLLMMTFLQASQPPLIEN